MAPRTSARSSAPHAADTHDLIRVHGARVNNLKDVSVEIPKRRLTVFTGVSGSGKSSLVFDTIAAESQRLINETYSTFVQGFMPSLARPEVDVLDGLTPAIIVDQQRMGADSRSTVGTATDANAMLRILFSRLGKPHVGPPSAFSFNMATARGSGSITVERGARKVERKTFTRHGGMCPRCEGRGAISDIDLTQLLDDSKSLAEGAIIVPGWTIDNFFAVKPYLEAGFLDRAQADPQIHQGRAGGLPPPRADQGEGQRRQRHLRRIDPEAGAVFPLEGQRDAAAAHPGLRPTGCHLHDLSRVRRDPAQRRSPVVQDQRDQHCRRCAPWRSAQLTQWVRSRSSVSRPAHCRAEPDPGLVR